MNLCDPFENSFSHEVVKREDFTAGMEKGFDIEGGLNDLGNFVREKSSSAEAIAENFIARGRGMLSKLKSLYGEVLSSSSSSEDSDFEITTKMNELCVKASDRVDIFKRDMYDLYEYAKSRTLNDKKNLIKKNDIHDCDLIDVLAIRDRVLSKNKLSLSQKDFFDYFISRFSNEFHLKQSNVGVCSNLCAICELGNSPWIEVMCRASIKKNRNGSWEVKLPLASKKGKVYNISKVDLDEQWNSSGNFSDLRHNLKPVNAKIGIKVLEAALIQSQTGNMNRWAAEGGRPNDVLNMLGGENFSESAKIIETFSLNGRTDCKKLRDTSEENQKKIDSILANYDSNVDFVTVATDDYFDALLTNKITKILVKGKIVKHPFHAYAVVATDPEKKTVTVVNPHNTYKRYELTLDEFKGIFKQFEATKVNLAKLKENLDFFDKNI